MHTLEQGPVVIPASPEALDGPSSIQGQRRTIMIGHCAIAAEVLDIEI